MSKALRLGFTAGTVSPLAPAAFMKPPRDLHSRQAAPASRTPRLVTRRRPPTRASFDRRGGRGSTLDRGTMGEDPASQHGVAYPRIRSRSAASPARCPVRTAETAPCRHHARILLWISLPRPHGAPPGRLWHYLRHRPPRKGLARPIRACGRLRRRFRRRAAARGSAGPPPRRNGPAPR